MLRRGIGYFKVGDDQLFVISARVAEIGGRTRQIKTLARRGRPRIVILLVQHGYQQRKQAHPLLGIVGLPHADFEIGKSVGIKLTQRARALRWSKQSIGKCPAEQDRDEPADEPSGTLHLFPATMTCAKHARSMPEQYHSARCAGEGYFSSQRQPWFVFAAAARGALDQRGGAGVQAP